MKYFLFLPVVLLSAINCLSQTTTSVSMAQDFSALVKAGGGGVAAFQSFSSNQVDGSQFFIPDWKPGEIKTTHQDVFNEGFLFLYDKVRQELFIRQKDSSIVLLGNKDEIQSFNLKDNGSQYNFVNSKLFSVARPEVFYQTLIYDSVKLSLFKYTKTTLVKADMSDMMKQREGNVYDAFVDKYFYYIVNGKSEPEPVLLKSKSIKKVFTDLHINGESYMNKHPEPIDEAYLLNMVNQLNK